MFNLLEALQGYSGPEQVYRDEWIASGEAYRHYVATLEARIAALEAKMANLSTEVPL